MSYHICCLLITDTWYVCMFTVPLLLTSDTLPLTHTLPRTHSSSHTPSLSHPPSHMHPPSHTHTLHLTQTFPLTQTLSHTLPHTHPPSHTPSLSHTHSSHTYPPSHTYPSLTHPPSLTHTHTQGSLKRFYDTLSELQSYYSVSNVSSHSSLIPRLLWWAAWVWDYITYSLMTLHVQLSIACHLGPSKTRVVQTPLDPLCARNAVTR